MAQSPGGPSTSTNLSAWYDARAGVSNPGTATITWGCKAGLCTPGTLTRQSDGTTSLTSSITLVAGAMNFNPALRYSGTYFLGTAAINNQAWLTPAGQGSVFGAGAISDQIAVLARGQTGTDSCGANRCGVGLRFTGTTFSNSGTTAGATTYSGTDGPTVNLYGLWAQVGASPAHTASRNGWNSTGTAYNKLAYNDYQFRMGSFPGYAYGGASALSLAEGIVFNRLLTATEAQITNSYLGIKYGVTLDTDGTRNNATSFNYLNSAGTQVWSGTNATYATYHNNVFGLGRDDGTSLDQRISTNVNNGGAVGAFPLDLLTLATGTLSSPAQFVYTLQTSAEGTAAGNGTQLSNNQFLMVGNNAGSTTTGTAVAVTGNSTAPAYNGNWTRLTRLWRAQNTGAVGTVSLLFNLPAAGVTALGGNLNNVVLLIDNDGNYTNGGTRIVTAGRSVSGNQISFNATLASGEIFTLASSTQTLRIDKTTVNAAGTYGFTLSNTTPTTGSVTVGANATASVDTNAGTAGVQPFSIVAANLPVTVTENALPANVTLTALSCTNSVTGGNTFSPSYNLATRTVTLPADSVNAGAQIVCTFTNSFAGPPLTCDSTLYLSQTGATSGQLYTINRSNNPFTFPALGGTFDGINALGYNPADNYLYALRSQSTVEGTRLYRINATGALVDLGLVTGLPAPTGSAYFSGAFTTANDNILYVMTATGGNTMYRVNVTTRVATAFTLSRNIYFADLDFANGLFYGYETSGQLVSIDPSSGIVTNIGPAGPNRTFGAFYADSDGLYGIWNTGGFFRFDAATGQQTLISDAPPSSSNDGARCPLGPPLSFNADLAVTKTDNNPSYTPGTNVVYTIVVSNLGPFGAQNARVQDALSPGISTANWTCAAANGAVCRTASGSGAIDARVDLPFNTSGAGATATFTLTVAVPGNFSGNLVNTVTVTPAAGNTDPVPGNNTATDTNTFQPNFGTCDARMFLDQVDTSPTPDVSTLFNVGYAAAPFTFTSLGSGLARNGIGYNPLDNYLYGIEWDGTTGNELIRVGSDGSSVNLGVVSGLPVANYNNGVISPSGEYYVTSGAGGTTLYRINLVTRAATAISMSQSIQVSDLAWYSGRLYGVSGGSLVSVDPASGAVASIGSSAPLGLAISMWGSPSGLMGSSGGSIYAIDPATGRSTLLSTAPASSNADGANCPTAPILLNADLAITKTDGNTTYTPGTNVVYTITVSNLGPFGAQGVTVGDPLPAGITTANWVCTANTGGSVCRTASGSGALTTVLDMPSGSTATFTLTMAVPADFTGNLVNTATVAAGPGNTDPVPGNNTATDTNTQNSQSNLSIAKTNSAASVVAGGTTSYTLVVTNAGPSSANGAVVRDDWTTAPGLNCSAGPLTCVASGTAGTQCPAPASLTPAALQSGIAVPVLPSGGVATFTLVCAVTATGQ